jgi:hypothetical protein
MLKLTVFFMEASGLRRSLASAGVKFTTSRRWLSVTFAIEDSPKAREVLAELEQVNSDLRIW